MRGNGFASAMMSAVCRDADDAATASDAPTLVYLSTSSPANVGFYRRFGFATVAASSITVTTPLPPPVGGSKQEILTTTAMCRMPGGAAHDLAAEMSAWNQRREHAAAAAALRPVDGAVAVALGLVLVAAGGRQLGYALL